jgi:2-oxoglutarate ferredoxin oxidoreductase subunit beta
MRASPPTAPPEGKIMIVIDTTKPPQEPAKQKWDTRPDLLIEGDHDLCPGCGEPIALRCMLEVIEEMGLSKDAIGAVGIGCYTALTSLLDTDMVQCLHGRAPSVATGIKRMRPQSLVYTMQGDGDMVNEGLQEIIHSAARGENITCLLLNNGVFGETGGHMTATTVIGQRTKNTLEGRDAAYHGHPISMTDLLAPLGGVGYVARSTVTTAKDIQRTRRYFKKAFETQRTGKGLSFIEVLTMCPTGWFLPVQEGPDYLNKTMSPVFQIGEFKVDGKIVTPEGQV